MNAWLADSLQWYPEKGCGFFPVRDTPYNAAYFEKYEGYADTEQGRAITDARVAFASTYCVMLTVDVGIGCGQFVNTFDCLGYDVNPAGVRWLRDRNLWHDPYAEPIEHATFWDSFEHIKNPAPLLANIRHSLVMTIPIFDGPEHVLRSKHYRKDEHYWYFTDAGLKKYMADHGFRCVAQNSMEQALGREGVETYAFTR